MQIQNIKNNPKITTKNSFKALPVQSCMLRMKPDSYEKVYTEITKDMAKNSKKNIATTIALSLLGPLSAIGNLFREITGEEHEIIGLDTIPIITHTEKPKSAACSDKKNEEVYNTNEEELRIAIQDKINAGIPIFQISKDLQISAKEINSLKKKYNIHKMSEEEINREKLAKFIESNPERRKNLSVLRNYPNLSAKYKQLLTSAVIDPQNEENISYLNTLEEMFKAIFAQHKEMKYTHSAFASLEEHYINDIENICKTYKANLTGGGTHEKYMSLITTRRLTSENLENWSEYDNLTANEYLHSIMLKRQSIKRISWLKRRGFIKTYYIDKFNDDGPTSYVYTLEYPKDSSLSEKLKTLVHFRDALYPKTMLSLSKDRNAEKYTKESFLEELYIMHWKDNTLDSLFNLMNYLNPEALKDYDSSNRHIYWIKPDSEEFNELREKLYKAINTMDTENPRIEKVISALNNDEIFGDLIVNKHAKMRFLTRIVLPNLVDEDLETETAKYAKEIYELLNERLEKGAKIFLHSTNKEKTPIPSVFLGECRLGSYIKIGLNRDYQIHTIYEAERQENELAQANIED